MTAEARLRNATLDDVAAMDALTRAANPPPPDEPPLPTGATEAYLRYLVEHTSDVSRVCTLSIDVGAGAEQVRPRRRAARRLRFDRPQDYCR